MIIEDGNVGSQSKDVRSSNQKRIREDDALESRDDKPDDKAAGDDDYYDYDDDDEGFTRKFPHVYNFNGIPKEDLHPHCVVALSSFNEKVVAQQGTEYELVQVLKCVLNLIPRIYHLNFIARPKNATEDKNELFFAQVEWDFKIDTFNGALCCSCCCVLGPPDTETGLGSCLMLCARYPGLVHHPDDGFTKEAWPKSDGEDEDEDEPDSPTSKDKVYSSTSEDEDDSPTITDEI